MKTETIQSANEAFNTPFAHSVIDSGRNLVVKFLEHKHDPEVVPAIDYALRHTGEVITRQVLEQVPKNAPSPECEKGCSYCCYLMVLAIPTEIFTIALSLRESLTPERFAIFREHLRSLAKKTGPMNSVEREGAKIPCSFLHPETGECGIYPIRPLSCVGFNSLSKARCQRFYETPQLPEYAEMFAPIYVIANALHSGALLGCHNEGLDASSIELNEGIDFVIDDLDNMLRRWLAGEKIFEAIQKNPDPKKHKILQHLTKDEIFDMFSAHLRMK